MPQSTSFTPIQLYSSSTASAVPLAANLTNSIQGAELAINIADGKLFYKDSGGVVQVIGTKGGVGSSTTTQVLYNSGGLVVGNANMTFNGTTLSLNTLNLTNALGVASGGTGLTSLTANYIPYGNGTGAFNSSAGLTFNGTGLTSGYFIPSSATIPINGLFLPTTNTLGFSTNTTEQMRLDVSGNLGIGTSSPSYKLDVVGTGTQTIRIQTNTSGNPTLLFTAAGANAGYLQYNRTAQAIQLSADSTNNFYSVDYTGLHQWFKSSASETMRLDASGNLLVGTTTNIYPTAGRTVINVNGTSQALIGMQVGGVAKTYILHDGTNLAIQNQSAGYTSFATNNIEQMRIASTGAIGLSGANYGTSGQVLTSNGSASAPTWQNATASSGPAFSAYQSVAQTLPTSTNTKIQLQTKEFDTNSNFDAVTNYRFTPTVGGYYLVVGTLQVASSSTAILPIIYKNGSAYKYGNDANSMGIASVSALVQLNGTTDYVEFWGSLGTGQALVATSVSTYFQGSFIRGL